MARRKTTNGSGAKKVDGLKGVRIELGKLRHDTNVRFLATERVIASGFAELSDNGALMLAALRENSDYARENTVLLKQMVEQGKAAANLEPRVSRCEFEIDEIKKKT